MEYGVNVSNKFAFLSGDEDVQDPDELIAKVEQAKKEKVSALKKDVKKSVEKKVTIAAPLHSTGNKENVDRRPPRRDGPRNNNNSGFERKGVRNSNHRSEENSGDVVSTENRPPRNNRPPRDGQPRDGAPRFNNVDRNGPGARRFNGPRLPRTENSGDVISDENQVDSGNRPPRFRRGNNGFRGDRNSGSDKTGVRSVPKKDGFGRGNWGTENDELTVEADPANADASLNVSAEKVENVEGQVEGENAEAEPEVEQVRELTLEEYKAQHKSEQPNFNIRKPGEGGDKKIYQKLVPIKRIDSKKTDEVLEDDVQAKREPREKALNIEVSFNDPQRNRGPRGFRDDRRVDGFREGGNRGGLDRRQGGGNRPSGTGLAPSSRRTQQGSQFNLTPESFPALGSR